MKVNEVLEGEARKAICPHGKTASGLCVVGGCMGWVQTGYLHGHSSGPSPEGVCSLSLSPVLAAMAQGEA